MSTPQLNPQNAEALLLKYQPNATPFESKGQSGFKVLCPFHADTNPSFHLMFPAMSGRCLSCGAVANMQKLIAAWEGCTYETARTRMRSENIIETTTQRKDVKQGTRKLVSCGFSFEHVRMFHDALMMNAAMREVLFKKTHWTEETLDRFSIGYDGQRYTIPAIYEGVVHNIKYYSPDRKPKYTGVTGFNQTYLWPMAHMQQEVIWLCEGEKDCITACQLGLNAVTFSGGAGQLPREFIVYFTGKHVRILYDVDAAGMSGAAMAAKTLARVAQSVRIVPLPAQYLPPNGDLTDFVLRDLGDAASLEQYAELAQDYEYQTTSRIEVGGQVLDTYLEDVVTRKLFFKRIKTRARVISAASERTFVVPHKVRMTCDQGGGDLCGGCPLHGSDPIQDLEVQAHFQEILQLIETPVAAQKTVLGKIHGITERCKLYSYEVKEHQYMYPIALIPALEKDKPYHSYTVIYGWSFSEPAEANEDYLVEAVVLSNPDTQQMTVVCYRMQKDVASADEFELSPEMIEQLKVFQCTASTTSKKD